MAHVVCFTGKRPKDLFGYDRDMYQDIEDDLVRMIGDLILARGFTRFLTGGAQGADQLAFWAVDAIKRQNPARTDLRNELVLPFEGQAALWSERGMFGREDYERMKTTADAVEYVSAGRSLHGQDLNDAYHRRNRRMVDQADLVCVISPRPLATRSGTGQTVAYARKTGREMVLFETRDRRLEEIH